MIPRRIFLKTAAGGSALVALDPLGLLSRLPAVSAAEATVPPRTVQLHADIEPLVRLLEETPRERVLEEVAARIHRGLSYREVLAALMLAGVRSIQPRPVGFKFHAVLVINSAHLASLASPDSDRWLPIFWAIDQFKTSQAANVKEGNWTMPPVDESAVPPSHRAREAFVAAMDRWDETAADAAIAGLVRSAGADELFDLFSRYGARDFRDIGHKMIYVSNSFRCLEVIGWQHAEPVLRSLTYALLERSGAKENPADADLPADRPGRDNLIAQKELTEGWTGGQRKPGATVELLELFRTGSAADASKLSVQLLKDGTAPGSLFDAYFCGAGELLMRAPGIVSLHAVTFTNAAHYAWQRCRNDETRRLLILQNAAFLPLFRGAPKEHAVKIDTLEPLTPTNPATGVVEIFDEISRDRLAAARKILAQLQASPDAAGLFAQSARRLVFAKGTNSHDYKFSSAVLEDYRHLSSPWRDRLLAASAFYLRGSGDRDNALVQRTRAALAS